MTDVVTVKVPATSANLGAGFDSLGLALSLYDEVSARIVEGRNRVEVIGEGKETLPTDESHLIIMAINIAWREWGCPQASVELRCQNRVPQARGLGSSSAAIVAGVVLASELTDQVFPSRNEQLRIAAAIEGHPDNVAPCLLGGFTIAWMGDSGACAVVNAVDPRVHPVIYVPEGKGLTATARAALPEQVPHPDAVFNVSRSALMVHAMTRDPTFLWEATDDRLHQRYRSSTMPESVALVSALRDAGIPAAISGAGPSVLAFCDAPPAMEGFMSHILSVASGTELI